jgi:uncharacterized protein YdeI (YjbR/CyaY-like superfamily)
MNRTRSRIHWKFTGVNGIIQVMEAEDALYFKDRQAWRDWLARSHATEKEVWILRYRKSSSIQSINYEEAVEEAIAFGWIDGKVKGIDSEKSALRFSPRKSKSVWSALNKARAERLIKEGKMTAAGLATIEEAKKSGAWEKAYVLNENQDIPADLEKALTADKEAWNNFHNFAPSRRNTYIYRVNDAKTTATRQRRINEAVSLAARPKQQEPLTGQKWRQRR